MSLVEPFKALVEVNVIDMIVVAFREHELMFPWWELEFRESGMGQIVVSHRMCLILQRTKYDSPKKLTSC
jgi:hypothetical protein